ncbi:MAG: thioredoxin family protein [Acidobacteriota bacterium]
MRLLLLLTILLSLPVAGVGAVPPSLANPSAPVPSGWSGADLSRALRQARQTHQPLLLFIRKESCPSCARAASLLTRDPGIRRLTLPFLRLWVSLNQEDGARLGRQFKITRVPAVLLLGPGGHVATRQEGAVVRAWLEEQLAIVARRHAPLTSAPHPDTSALLASLRRLQEYGDRQGAGEIRRRLRTSGRTRPAPALLDVEGAVGGVETEADLREILSRVDDPARIRALSFRLSTDLEDRGHSELALEALEMAAERLGLDPLTEARAAFLASRHKLRLVERRLRLMDLRKLAPRSLPLLLALIRVAEQTDHLFQAFHVAEAAAVYQPDDAWASLELHRLRFLVLIKSHTAHDPV